MSNDDERDFAEEEWQRREYRAEQEREAQQADDELREEEARIADEASHINRSLGHALDAGIF